MALETEEGLVLLEQIIGHCAMGVMALQATLRHWGMLEHKGALVTGMALKTQVIEAFFGLEHPRFARGGSVRIVAAPAGHLALL